MVGCYIWFSEEGTGQGRSPPRSLLVVPNVTAHPSTASVPITAFLYNRPSFCGFNVPIKELSVNSCDFFLILWRRTTCPRGSKSWRRHCSTVRHFEHKLQLTLTFHIGNLVFRVYVFKVLHLMNCAVNVIETYNVYTPHEYYWLVWLKGL